MSLTLIIGAIVFSANAQIVKHYTDFLFNKFEYRGNVHIDPHWWVVNNTKKIASHK
jgi:hypothetical protein